MHCKTRKKGNNNEERQNNRIRLVQVVNEERRRIVPINENTYRDKQNCLIFQLKKSLLNDIL